MDHICVCGGGGGVGGGEGVVVDGVGGLIWSYYIHLAFLNPRPAPHPHPHPHPTLKKKKKKKKKKKVFTWSALFTKLASVVMKISSLLGCRLT